MLRGRPGLTNGAARAEAFAQTLGSKVIAAGGGSDRAQGRHMCDLDHIMHAHALTRCDKMTMFLVAPWKQALMLPKGALFP